ncbi:hypothetical protein C9I86_19355 [Photobacterium sp. NCIMB 13483]|uniref:hypothetical protein n=1 Tax=Photobacterium sp. NCIMB 13483 TaxID=2022103 RepID=UPI000D173DC4|nr:hypothetical protein [Photobacterium sp. NCIMB 13483]PST85370.1 hypothetical protein C9I86_19355 [Photobacterium sp. NCIMB 13483]
MNKHQQSGMTTLLITSMLLIVALLFSLASYKNLFYQIKRTQNEVLARQAHWIAEGGLECGFVELKQKNIRPTDPGFSKKCTVLAPISELSIGYSPLIIDQPKYELISHYSNAVIKHDVSKSINYGGGGVSSTLETSGSVELSGSQHFVPNPTASKKDGLYKCKSIVAGGEVNYVAGNGGELHFLTTDFTVSGHAGGPLGVPPFTCHSEYRSNMYDVNKQPDYTVGHGKFGDIVENQTVNVFKNIFGKELTEANLVREEFRSHPKGIVITGKTSGGWIIDCSQKIQKAYASGKRRIWADGSCAITGDILGGKNKPTNDEAIQLVIFDGLFHIYSVSFIDGLIYQYISPSFNIKEGWLDFFNSASSINVLSGDLSKSVAEGDGYNKYVFNIFSSINIDGGIGVDAPNRTIRINGSIVPAYNADKAGKYINVLTWQQGSWHDF